MNGSFPGFPLPLFIRRRKFVYVSSGYGFFSFFKMKLFKVKTQWAKEKG